MDKLEESYYFVTTVYSIHKPEFLELVKAISDRYLELSEVEGEKKMTVMTRGYAHEALLESFTQYVSQTAWNILKSQGYDVDKMYTYFTEMWTQEHNTFSSMDCHMHGNRSQITCFYFLDTPENGCQLVIYDPRPAKTIINLGAAEETKITQATPQVVITPKAGLLVFTNAWLPHSFSKNFSKEPCRFVHMNLSVNPLPPEEKTPDEVVDSCNNPEQKPEGCQECCEAGSCKKDENNNEKPDCSPAVEINLEAQPENQPENDVDKSN